MTPSWSQTICATPPVHFSFKCARSFPTGPAVGVGPGQKRAGWRVHMRGTEPEARAQAGYPAFLRKFGFWTVTLYPGSWRCGHYNAVSPNEYFSAHSPHFFSACRLQRPRHENCAHPGSGGVPARDQPRAPAAAVPVFRRAGHALGSDPHALREPCHRFWYAAKPLAAPNTLVVYEAKHPQRSLLRAMRLIRLITESPALS